MRCLLCGKTSGFSTIWHSNKLLVVRCGSCGAVFQPYPDQGEEENIERYYRKRVNKDVSKPSRSQQRCLKKLFSELKTLAPQAKNILDVGCGWGNGFLKMAKYKYDTAVGVELNEAQSKYAVKILGLNVYNEPYCFDFCPANSFDVITFIQVMEHLPDPLTTIRTAYKHLKPGGLLVIEVPSFNNPRVLLYRWTHIHRFARQDFIPSHISYFTAKTLSSCVEQSGFIVRKIETGNYRTKTGLTGKLGMAMDSLSNHFQIGGITLFAQKINTNDLPQKKQNQI